MSWPRSSSARPTSWAWRSCPRRWTSWPAADAARRASSTGCSSACATSPRSRPTAASRAREADAAMLAMDIDDEGLDTTDRRLLAAIVQKFASGPVGGAALAAVLGEEVETIEDVYEPYPAPARLPGPHAAGPRGHGTGARPPARPGLRGPAAAAQRTRRPRPVGHAHGRAPRRRRPARMTTALAVHGLRKAYGSRVALDGLDLEVPTRHGLRLPGPQRRRQDDHDAPAGRPHPARRGHARGARPALHVARPPPALRRRRADRGALVLPVPVGPREPARRRRHGRAGRARAGWTSCWAWSGCASARATRWATTRWA